LTLFLALTTRAVSAAEQADAIAVAHGMKSISAGDTANVLAGKLGEAQRAVAEKKLEMQELKKTLKEKAKAASANKYARGGGGFGGSAKVAPGAEGAYRTDEVQYF
jgi:hypothetical protein